MRGLAEDHNIIIKPADKDSCVAVWDREDYIADADRQLKDNEPYESSSFKDVDLVKLAEKSNSIFQSLRKRKLITEEELKYLVKLAGKSNSVFQLLEKGNLLLKKNLIILLINIRRPPISEKCTCFLRSIRVSSMYLVALLYQIAVRLLRKLPNF